MNWSLSNQPKNSLEAVFKASSRRIAQARSKTVTRARLENEHETVTAIGCNLFFCQEVLLNIVPHHKVKQKSGLRTVD